MPFLHDTFSANVLYYLFISSPIATNTNLGLFNLVTYSTSIRSSEFIRSFCIGRQKRSKDLESDYNISVEYFTTAREKRDLCVDISEALLLSF